MDYYKNLETPSTLYIPQSHCEFTLDCTKLNSHARLLDYLPSTNNHFTHIPGETRRSRARRTITYKFQYIRLPRVSVQRAKAGPRNSNGPPGNFLTSWWSNSPLRKAQANALTFGSVQITMHFLFYRTYSATIHNLARNIPKRTIRVPSFAEKPRENISSTQHQKQYREEKNKWETKATRNPIIPQWLFYKTISFYKDRIW